VWVVYLRLFQGLKEPVASKEVDEIAGRASGMWLGRIVEVGSWARRAGCRCKDE
jgi:hypothetical protein